MFIGKFNIKSKEHKVYGNTIESAVHFCIEDIIYWHSYFAPFDISWNPKTEYKVFNTLTPGKIEATGHITLQR